MFEHYYLWSSLYTHLIVLIRTKWKLFIKLETYKMLCYHRFKFRIIAGSLIIGYRKLRFLNNCKDLSFLNPYIFGPFSLICLKCCCWSWKWLEEKEKFMEFSAKIEHKIMILRILTPQILVNTKRINLKSSAYLTRNRGARCDFCTLLDLICLFG